LGTRDEVNLEVPTLCWIKEALAMKGKTILAMSLITGVLAAAGGWAASAGDKYTLKVPGGLAFSEFRGYEDWPVVAISENGGKIAVILGNPVLIDAYKAGIPASGKPFPDGSKMAKIHWAPKKLETQPGEPTVPGALHDVDFMVKDSKRFADSGGWGWAVFDYDAASDSFTPGTLADDPPQGSDSRPSCNELEPAPAANCSASRKSDAVTPARWSSLNWIRRLSRHRSRRAG
jgi:hypothetical protein